MRTMGDGVRVLSMALALTMGAPGMVEGQGAAPDPADVSTVGRGLGVEPEPRSEIGSLDHHRPPQYHLRVDQGLDIDGDLMGAQIHSQADSDP